MIELTVLDHLSEQLTVPVYMELPSGAPDRFVVLRKADSGRENFIYSAMFTFRSYGESLLEAARLNEQVKAAVDRISELDAVASEGLVTVKYSWRERDGKRGKGEYMAKNDFMARLQMIVAAHNIAKYNGYYHRVSGLPDMYGESLDITYASGESIYANDNQSGFLPIRAVRELIVHFGAATETENE